MRLQNPACLRVRCAKLNEVPGSKLQMYHTQSYVCMKMIWIFCAYCIHNDATVRCTWTSQNEDVAAVKDGVITAKRKVPRSILCGCCDSRMVFRLLAVVRNHRQPHLHFDLSCAFYFLTSPICEISQGSFFMQIFLCVMVVICNLPDAH